MLNRLRSEIDRIDRRIVKLLNERAGVAVRIGREKAKQDSPVTDAAREAEVLEQVDKESSGPLTKGDLTRIYEVIIDACTRLQEKERSGDA